MFLDVSFLTFVVFSLKAGVSSIKLLPNCVRIQNSYFFYVSLNALANMHNIALHIHQAIAV